MNKSAILLCTLGLMACAPDKPDVPEGPRYYEATGNIVSIEGEHVLIDHGDIPGFMDAMTMSFPVSDPALLQGLETGTHVKFRVVVEGASYAIDQIEPTESPL